jgi:hypothetical protein
MKNEFQKWLLAKAFLRNNKKVDYFSMSTLEVSMKKLNKLVPTIVDNDDVESEDDDRVDMVSEEDEPLHEDLVNGTGLGVESKEEDDSSSAPPPKKRRKKNSIRKYSTYCKKREIPYPVLSERELEHLDDCTTCQNLWPLYLYWQQYEMKVAYDDVLKNWVNIRERERELLYKKLFKEEIQWKRNMLQSRPPTGYQIFLKEKRQSNEQLQNVKFGDCTKILAKLWATLTADQKKVYEDTSIRLKKEKVQFLDSLPAFKKKDYESSKRKIKSALRAKRPPKPCNAFMRYLSSYWKQEKAKNTVLKYKDIMQIASDNWYNKMTEEEKIPFRSQFLVAKEQYLIEKQKMQDTGALNPAKPAVRKDGTPKKIGPPKVNKVNNNNKSSSKIPKTSKILKKRKRDDEKEAVSEIVAR